MRSLVCLLLLVPGAAFAQDCQSYIGTSPSLTPIQDAIAQFDGITPKDEFETTDEYEARIAAASSGAQSLVIPKTLDPASLDYDADRQVFKVGRYLFDNANMPVGDLWSYGGPFYDAGNYDSRSYNIDIVVDQDDEVTGAYTGTNAYGASTEVAEIDRIYWGVYERPVSIRDGFSASSLIEGEGDYIGEIPMVSAEARQFKDGARTAFVVVPNAPWQVRYREEFGSDATIQNPAEIKNVMNVLFADIQCALVIDRIGTAVAAFETR